VRENTQAQSGLGTIDRRFSHDGMPGTEVDDHPRFADFQRRNIMTSSDDEPNVDSSGTHDRVVVEKGETGDRAWREWMTIGMGLTGLLSILSTIVAVVALANPGTQPTPASASMSAMMASSAMPASTAPAAKTDAVKLTIKSDDEHGKRGPDGKWHDAYLPANFTVHAGDRVTVTVYNYDTGSHTFTSPTLSAAGLINEMIPAGSENAPHKTTFTFTAPSQTGKYLWWCAMPCDPWAMAHIGYMRGYVTVVA
jgi:plastocyanin